jgi:DNA replication protein DnaC
MRPASPSSSTTERLSDVFARLRLVAGQYDPVADTPLEDLVNLPSTELLRFDRDRLAAALDAYADGVERAEPLQARVTLLRRQLRRHELRLAQAEHRDRLGAGRPAGCWCLGLGGRDRVPLGYAHGTDRDGRPALFPVRDPAGDVLTGFRQYCPCPAGQSERAASAAAQQRAASEHRARRVARLWDGIGVPSRFAEASLDSYLERNPAGRETVAQLRAWLAGDQWLVLWGPVGRGKTGLAAGLTRELVGRGQGVLFRTVPDLLDRLRATYDGAGHEHELMAALFAVDLLVLDDVGAERPTDWAAERLFRLLNHRYDERRQTVVTTNLDPSNLAKHLGNRTFDRLREMARPSGFVRVGGPNLRDNVGPTQATSEA